MMISMRHTLPLLSLLHTCLTYTSLEREMCCHWTINGLAMTRHPFFPTNYIENFINQTSTIICLFFPFKYSLHHQLLLLGRIVKKRPQTFGVRTCRPNILLFAWKGLQRVEAFFFKMFCTTCNMSQVVLLQLVTYRKLHYLLINPWSTIFILFFACIFSHKLLSTLRV